MNFSSRNIYVALLAIVFGIYLQIPMADAGMNCGGLLCFHCNEKLFSVNASAIKVGVDDHLCDASLGDSPCDRGKNSIMNAPVVMTSPINAYRQFHAVSLDISADNSLLSLNAERNDKTIRFCITSGTSPIYLQNLSLLC